MNRMIELKGLSDDAMKNSSDNANYNREFQDLQQQLFDMGALKFNGVSLFATTTTFGGGTAAKFNNLNQNLALDNTVDDRVLEGNLTEGQREQVPALLPSPSPQTTPVSLISVARSTTPC